MTTLKSLPATMATKNNSASTVSWWQKKSLQFKTTAIALCLATVPTITLGVACYWLTDSITTDTTKQVETEPTVRQLRQNFLLATGAVACLGGAVGIFLARKMLRPILSTEATVAEIGRSNLQARVVVTGEDELARLGGNINLITARLGECIHERDTAVAQAELVRQITNELSLVEADAVFELAVARIEEALRADRVSYYLISDRQLAIVAESGRAEPPSNLGTQLDRDIFTLKQWQAFKNNTISAIDDIERANLSEFQLQHWQSCQTQAFLTVPINQKRRLVGLLVVARSTPHTWMPTDIKFLEQIAEQIDITLERIELLQQQRTIAIEAQQAKAILQNRASDLLQEVRELSEGNLTVRARVTSDEIGTIASFYNSTIEDLQQLVIQVGAIASEIKTKTNLNRLEVQQLSPETVLQGENAFVERVREMSELSETIAERTVLAKDFVKQARDILTGVSIDRTAEEINAIQNNTFETTKKVKQLEVSSQEISRAVSSIDRFAAQTHLLALKASIEAARAGERGKGFAVIADEVRSLATQSAAATAEIENLVARIQLETEEMSQATQIGTERVALISELMQQTRQSINSITNVSAKTNRTVEAIAEAAEKQCDRSEPIEEIANQVVAIAKDNTQLVAEISTIEGQLANVAEKLQAGIEKFQI